MRWLLPKALGEGCSDLVVDRQTVQGGQVGFVTEIGIGRAAQHGHGLADWRARPETDIFGVKGAEKLPDCTGVRNLHRFASKREIEAVQVDDDREAHPPVFGQAKGHEGAVQHLLAGGAVNLQKTAVPGRQDVVVIRLQGDGRGEPPGDVDQNEGGAPARHGIEHLHGVEQPLAGGGGEHPHPGGGRGCGGGQHGVLGFQSDHAAVHPTLVNPGGDGLDDLRLGGDGKGRHIIHLCQPRSPGRGAVAGQQSALHDRPPSATSAAASRSGMARMACDGHCARQIRQPLQCS